jgi:methyl-coenzyme M reductase subunit C
LSKSEKEEVLVLSMGPAKRHITKPVCEITYGLREAGIETSVYVLEAGIGPPAMTSEKKTSGVSSISGITEKEIHMFRHFKMLIIHLGNVPGHFVEKAKVFLENVDLPAIVVCQALVDFSDFEKANIRTTRQPNNTGTAGTIVDYVTGVIRGQSVPAEKLEEIVFKVKQLLERLNPGVALRSRRAKEMNI